MTRAGYSDRRFSHRHFITLTHSRRKKFYFFWPLLRVFACTRRHAPLSRLPRYTTSILFSRLGPFINPKTARAEANSRSRARWQLGKQVPCSRGARGQRLGLLITCNSRPNAAAAEKQRPHSRRAAVEKRERV